MNKLFLFALFALGALLGLSVVRAQNHKTAGASEYVIVRWADPDVLLYHYPNGRFEEVRVLKTGKAIPRGAANEEFCLTEAANFLARTGWELVQLDGSRLIGKRPLN